MLADLGADVVKVERPGAGDDTRAWGPPFVAGARTASDLSAPPITTPATAASARSRSTSTTAEGASIVRRLAAHADVLIENFKVGGLAKYGLDHAGLRALNPRLDLLLDHRLRPGRPLRARAPATTSDPGHGRAHVTSPARPTASRRRSASRSPTSSPAFIRRSRILAALRRRERDRRGRHHRMALLDTPVGGARATRR